MTNTIDTNNDDRLKITAKSRLMLDMLATACSLSPEDVQKHVTRSPDGAFCIDMHVGTDEQVSTQEEKPHKPKLELPQSQLEKIKGECLARYARKRPKLFFQIDCWGPDWAGDSEIDPECTGRGATWAPTWDLMHGSPIRILIADDYTDHELVADMMTDAAEWLRREPALLRRHHEWQWAEKPHDSDFLDDDIPF